MGFFNRTKVNKTKVEEVPEEVIEEIPQVNEKEREINQKFIELFTEFSKPVAPIRVMNLTSLYTLPTWKSTLASKVSCWMKDDSLYFLSDKEALLKTQEDTGKKQYTGYTVPVFIERIPIHRILCFGIRQKVLMEEEFFSAHGYNFSNAMPGGIFTEVLGSTYAARKAIAQLGLNAREQDKYTMLYYKDEHELLCYLPFNPVDYYTFQNLIPTKELKMAMKAVEKREENKQEESKKPVRTSKGIERLRELRDMFDSDLITEEEFRQKRKEILNEI